MASLRAADGEFQPLLTLANLVGGRDTVDKPCRLEAAALCYSILSGSGGRITRRPGAYGHWRGAATVDICTALLSAAPELGLQEDVTWLHAPLRLASM